MNPDTRLRNMTAIYITRGDEMLMLYRVGSRVVDPSWCGIGGHFEESELNDPYACVLRELEEETGIHRDMMEDIRFKYVTIRLKKGEIRQNYYYFANLKADVELSLESDEGKLRWVPLNQVMEKDMPLTAKFMLDHYLKTGRFDDCLYSGVTRETDMVFTKLTEF